MQAKEDLENAGALMFGVGYTSLNPDPVTNGPVVLSLDEAGAILATDFWPMTEWPISNDAEKYLRGSMAAFPHMFVINLKTMEVHTAREGVFGENGFADAQELVDTIASF